MSLFRYYFQALALLFFMNSCAEVIEVDSNFTTPELVVDAWLNDSDTTQTIFLSLSQGYFDIASPPAVTNATVVLHNQTTGQVCEFLHHQNGTYVWRPDAGQRLGDVGDWFRLEVHYQDWAYEATTELRRVPSVDSIAYEVRESLIDQPEGIYAQFYARDLPGEGDAYWIKTYKNGLFLNKPAEMNLSYDGALNPGSGIDGITFVSPVREMVNRLPDQDTADDLNTPPYKTGDHIRVEIHSITRDAFRFLSIAKEQMTNGDNNIFALPLANAPGNIKALDTGAPDALGFFSISAVSSYSILVE